ncbi:uncharacterized protein METZ01_LOCUS17754 [marine metagenome]|uniref:Uncharacterized protein n=1 Tax=marine metagenome TaxID=408172 RepID=A0A381PD84_9ZZZZ
MPIILCSELTSQYLIKEDIELDSKIVSGFKNNDHLDFIKEAPILHAFANPKF